MSKILIKHGKKCLVFLLVLATVFSAAFTTITASAKTLAEKFEAETETEGDVGYDRAETTENTYQKYLQEVEEKGYSYYTGPDIVLTPDQATSLDQAENSTQENVVYKDVPLVNNEDSLNEEAIEWTSDYSGFRWTFQVEQSGLYTISMNYLGIGSLGISATRELAINGQVPFTEASEITFKKWFVDESDPIMNSAGDFVASSLLEVRQWTNAIFRDRAGYYTQEFRFYLEAGENTIEMYYGDQDLYIGDLILSAPEDVQSYDEYIAQYSDLDTSGTDRVDYFQAEDRDRIVLKSSNTMRITNNKGAALENIVRTVDTSSGKTVVTFTDEFEIGSGAYTMMNQVGGDTNWYQNRDSYTWNIEVPEDGLYKIVLRVGNSFNAGMPVFRQIYIDGEVPYEEMLAYRFRYSSGYYTETLSDDDGNPYLFYLTAGTTHELKMETLMGELGTVALTLRDEMTVISDLMQQIRRISGSNPDPNYDYNLETRIPELIPTLEGLITSFEEMIEILQRVCQTDSSSAISELRTSIDTIQSFLDDTFGIPSRTSDLSEIQTNLGTWITNFESSPLQIDYIQVYEPEGEVQTNTISFWKKLANTWECFIASFTKDYNVTVEDVGEDGKEIVEVWINRDREYADLIKALLDEAFQDADFAINFRIVPGQIDVGSFNLLLLSMMSGNQPDMTWSCLSTTPVNFAIRGVGYNLEQFEDFDEIRERFVDGTMISYEYSDNTGIDGTFGLPETMNFYAMFYRKDILSDLGLNVPTTWDEVYDTIIPTFYQENYQMAPVAADIYLLQKNGYRYRSENRLYGWDTEIAYDAFMEHVEQYLVYGMDVSTEPTQGFRDGLFPLVYGGFDFYTTLKTGAPELLGKWGIAPIPGTVDELGVVNRATSGADGGFGMMIISTDDMPAQHAEECWEIMKWWTSADVQTEFEYIVDAYFGQANRWASANKEAFLALPWTAEERAVIEEQFNWYLNVPIVLGSYQADRYSSFAFNQVVVQGLSARDAIETMVDYVNTELRRKQIEYGITPATQEEIDNKVYDVTAADKLPYYQQLREEAQAKLEQGSQDQNQSADESSGEQQSDGNSEINETQGQETASGE